MSHAVTDKPTSNSGICNKFSAFCIGAAATIGTMAYFLISPTVGGAANAAGSAMLNTAAKVAEASGIIETGKATITQAAGAYIGHQINARADRTYLELRCDSPITSFACFKNTFLGVVGVAIVVFAAINLCIIMGSYMPKTNSCEPNKKS